MRQQNGFTLIELLVVVAIIALLVGILVPSLQGARESAIEVKCSAQAHQLGRAIHFYANDNYQRLFWRLPNVSINSYGMEWYSWVGRETGNPLIQGSTNIFNTTLPRPLNAYIDDTIEVARDPGDDTRYDWPGGSTESIFEALGNSYVFNSVGHPTYASSHPNNPVLGPAAGGLRGHSLTQIERPSQTVLLMDSGLIYPPGQNRSWHREGLANVAFCDGHVSPETIPSQNPYNGGDNEGMYWDARDY